MKISPVPAALIVSVLIAGDAMAAPGKPAAKAPYTVDVSKSSLHWKARKVTSKHMGDGWPRT